MVVWKLKVTTHSEPTFEVDGVVHYAVANMPGAVARTSTFALANATLPYMIQLANHGLEQACNKRPELIGGVNTYAGKCTYEAVAEAHNLDYVALSSLMG